MSDCSLLIYKRNETRANYMSGQNIDKCLIKLAM